MNKQVKIDHRKYLLFRGRATRAQRALGGSRDLKTPPAGGPVFLARPTRVSWASAGGCGARRHTLAYLAYSGGFTNTEQAILKCNATLNTSTADVKYIALFTDGAPTVFGFTDTGPSSGCNVNGGPVGSDCRNAAVDAAEAAKAAGIQIATILVSTVSATEDFLANEIASPGLNYTADSFADVDKLVKDIIFEVDPCE